MIWLATCLGLLMWGAWATIRAGVHGERRMDEFIAKANIQHFKEKLATEKDEAKRKLLLQLLAEEEQKLAAALRRKRGED